MKMNLPNKLTILRAVLVPVFVACMLYIPNTIVRCLVSAGVFGITSLTDMFDGKIARKYNLVTNFGKFMDPLADKFMVFSALITITVVHKSLTWIMIWVSCIVFLRELAVTSLRLICAEAGAGAVAANFFGKAKTVTQITCIIVILLEETLRAATGFETYYIASYVTIAAMTFMTIASGLNYFKAYKQYINPNR